MYCRHCDLPLEADMEVCPRCGCPRGEGVRFCPACGRPTLPDEATCLGCGEVLIEPKIRHKSRALAAVLAFLLGFFGVHNFYLGYTGKAIAQLLTTLLSVGTLGFISLIWAIVEGVLILTGTITVDGNGIPLE